MSNKLSKSDGPIDYDAIRAEKDTLYKLTHQPHLGTQPGDGCRVLINGTYYPGRYTDERWELTNAEVQHTD